MDWMLPGTGSGFPVSDNDIDEPSPGTSNLV
jgi:hypothetical protein